MLLGEVAARSGYRLEALDSAGSTNDVAARRLAEGDAGDLWVTATRQTGGRGRSGRTWTSPPGNLYASLLLRSPCLPRLAPQLGFVAGVALHDAVAAACPGISGRLALKWPNDLLLDGRKLAGILIDGVSLPPAGIAAVVGIGVNVTGHPAGTPYPATDLAANGAAVTVEALFGRLSDRIAGRIAQWAGGAGFGAIRADWLERAGGIGAPITVRRPDGDRRGIFVDIDADGRLLLGNAGHTLAIAAGDVFLEGASPASSGEHELDTH